MLKLVYSINYRLVMAPWPIVKARRRRLIYSLSCILLALLTTLVIVINGADCLSSVYVTNSTSSNDKVFVVSSNANRGAGGAHNTDKDSFSERFDKSVIPIKENTPIGSKLVDIEADQDTPEPGIMYSIIGGSDRESFKLRKTDNNVNKVELVNSVEFDYESTKKSYHVIIRATSVFLRYELDLTILVTDENDNKPQLEDFAIVFNNYKNSFPTTPIGRVPASDADINDQLRYRVLAGNNAQLLFVNETNGDIQLNPWLNNNVPLRGMIVVAVSDGVNEAVAQLVLTVNLVTETMLQNSVNLRLDGINREDFLTQKYDVFINNMARILYTDSHYRPNNIVLFNVEEYLLELSPNEALPYRSYYGSSTINSTLSVNISFSARVEAPGSESYLSRQYIEERIYLNRHHLAQLLGVHVAPIQDNACVREPCQNYQECEATYKFEKASKSFITTRNMIFRPIRAVQSSICTCPPTFTGMKHKTECNIQINQCFSNPCLNGGICHRHESGYSCECKPDFVGSRCEHSFANSTCQNISLPTTTTTTTTLINSHLLSDDPSLKQMTMCSGKSRCVNISKSHFTPEKPLLTRTVGGFSCQGCPYPAWSTDLCQLKTRSFNKNSYITLPSLRRHHRFHIMLKFATFQNDALILYNGRYNDRNDFIALEIVESYLRFSYSLGSTVTSVSLPSVPVSDGGWHKVAINYRDRNVTILIDDCDPIIDEALAKFQSSTKRCSNTSYIDSNMNSDSKIFKVLDLTGPMQIGSLLSSPNQDFSLPTVNSFIGCISEIYIDHQLVDLYNPIQEAGTQIGCPDRRSFCQQQSCSGHPCQDSYGVAKCLCGDELVGKSCEISISNEKVRKFSGNSYSTFSPIDSTIPSNWQMSLHFRPINPNGILAKILLDSDTSIILELFNGGLKLSHRGRNITFNKITLDDGEWHYAEIIWTNDITQLQVDYNPNLSAQSSEMGNIVGTIIKSVTIGASPNVRDSTTSIENSDFTSSAVANNVPQDDFSNLYTYGGNSSQSFVGCIYGVNISDNAELWITASEERNLERGCVTPDVCETNSCPPNSHCIRKGLNQRKCVCNPGFVGDRCLPICDLNPCQGENSKCFPLISSNNPGEVIVDISDSSFIPSSSYRCECEAHRIGKNCEHQLSAHCPSNWWRTVAGGNSSTCGSCSCDETKGFDGDCDKTTGQCFCKLNHYQPVDSGYCLPCDCYEPGSLGSACNQTSGQCRCRPGVVGRRCDTCASSYAEVTKRGCEVIYDACPKTFSDGIWWEKTQLDTMATQHCPPSTSTGTATRTCHRTEGWQKPNLFDCISNSFLDLFTQYSTLEESKFPLTTQLAMKIANDLRHALNETISNPSSQLYGSDMYISFRLIHHLIKHESKLTGLSLTHRQDRMYIRNIAEAINYILDPAYSDNWPEISARSPDGGAEHLLRLIDAYGKTLIESNSDLSEQPFEVSTKYFTFGLDSLSTDQLWDISKTSMLNSQPSSPPYATDPFNPPMTGLDQVGGSGGRGYNQAHFNSDGSSIYLDYSQTRDSSPSIIIPKYDNYASDVKNLEDSTRASIPLKTLRIKTLQELLPSSPYYHAKSRAKREEITIPDFKFVRQQPALVVYSIYKTLGPLLPNNYDNTVQHRLGLIASANSPVVWLTVRTANGSEFLSKNIQPKITYMLKMVEPTGKTRPQCAVWDFLAQTPTGGSNKNQTNYGIKQTGKFSTKGCEIKGIHPNHKLKFKYDYVNCSCDHIGAVTVLMDSANYDYLANEDTNIKDTALISALSISLVIMFATYFILTCIRGHSIKSNSNSINKNLIFILIALELLILYTVISRSSLNQREYQCKLVAIFLHYFSISLFFWLLVNAIHFYRMLTELRDINHGPMKFYHVLGYAAPAFFVSIAVGLRIEQFGNYLFCWLSIHEPIIWSMFGPISFVSGIIIILFMLALCKSLPVKGDANGVDLVKNHMLINIVKTPLIGAYWLMTVYLVNEVILDSVYLFPTITIFKSIALFMLLCIVDKHIRYNLYVSWLRFKGKKVPFLEDSMNNYPSSQWIPPLVGEPGAVGKDYSYNGYNAGQVTTPGFQSSCTDIFRPDVLAFSAASTTSRSSATGTSSSAYQYQHRNKGVSRDAGYGRADRSRHRRRHKKSHHKHHHHRHHHHHHHHRSHRHHNDEYEHYDRRRYDVQQAVNDNNSQNELASSHSSDELMDDIASLPNNRQDNSDGQVLEEHQTVPMELSAPSTSGAQNPDKTIEIENESTQSNA